MHSAPEHRSTVELEQGLSDVLASPADNGRLTSIFVRPAPNERRALNTARLSAEGGIDGDRWGNDSFYKSKGGSDARCQISLMNSRYLRNIAGDDDAMCLAGDNLIVDFDLSEANLPAGSQLAIGDTVVIEITDLAHTGCGKFQNRYGKEARAFTNNERGTSLHLRGRYARVVRGGTIRVSDLVRKKKASPAGPTGQTVAKPV
jgi:MOSC domain-containing protein YiiM